VGTANETPKPRRPRKLGRGLSGLMQVDNQTKSEQIAAVHTSPDLDSESSETNQTKNDLSEDANPGDSASSSGREKGSPSGIREIELDRIEPSPYQPRGAMDDEALESLAASIRQSGVIQPILVRPAAATRGPDAGDARYELVAGERRWRAARLAGLGSIPAIVRELKEESAAELALVENIQREDLNAIERARALRMLVERFGLTHGEVGRRVGLNRSSVANLIRLSELEDEIQELIADDRIGAGHGKALLGAAPGAGRVELARQAASLGWSVRRLEEAVATSLHDGAHAGTDSARASDPADEQTHPDSAATRQRAASLVELERQLGEHLGTKVRVQADRTGQRGRLIVEFYGLEHFDGLIEKMGFRMD